MAVKILLRSKTQIAHSRFYSRWVVVGTGSNGPIYVIPTIGTSYSQFPLGMNLGNRCAARYNVTQTGSVTPAPARTAEFVTVGSGTSALAYVLEGDRYFVPLGLTQFSTQAYDVSFSQPLGMWIAGGNAPASYSSTDGVTWSPIAGLNALVTGVGAAVTAIAWSDTEAQWVAGSNIANAFLVTSPDGVTWTGRGGTLFGAGAVRGIVHSPTLATWVAVAYAGSPLIVYSTNAGVTWSEAVGAVNGINGFDVAWSPTLGIFLATFYGSSNNISTATSPNGMAWSLNNQAFAPTYTANGVDWNGTAFTVTGVGGGNTIMTSPDGVNFVGGGSSLITTTGYDACYSIDNGTSVYVGAGTYTAQLVNATSGVAYGSQAMTTHAVRCWSRYSMPETRRSARAGPTVPVDSVVVGSGQNSIAYRPYGQPFYTPIGLSIITGVGNDVAYSSTLGLWVAVGTGTNAAASSPNGYVWTALASLTTAITTGTSIAWSDNQTTWVAGGTGTNKIATSPDGVVWTGRASPFTTQVNGVAYSPDINTWVAVGSGTCAIAYAFPLPTTWICAMPVVSSVSGVAVTWSRQLGIFLVTLTGGASGAYSTVSSVNGYAWQTAAQAFQPNAVTSGLAWNGTVFYLTGTSTINTVMTSTNGQTFAGQGTTLVPGTANGVCWNGYTQQWILLGTSSTGSIVTLNATSGTTFSVSPFATQATRCTGYIPTPPSFTRTTPPVVNPDFVVVGSGTNTLAYTINDGITYTPLGVTALTTTGNDVAYASSLGIWIAVGSGTTRSTTSTNGVIWTPLASLQALITTSINTIAYSDNQTQWVAGEEPQRGDAPVSFLCSLRSHKIHRW